MKVLSYLVYTIVYQTLVLGGCGYAVFVRGYSGWWFLLAAILSTNQFTPKSWSRLWNDLKETP